MSSLLLVTGIIIDSYYMIHLDKILSLVNFLLRDVVCSTQERYELSPIHITLDWEWWS